MKIEKLKFEYELILDRFVERDRKQLVRRNLEHFHLFYNLFRNRPCYFEEQTERQRTKVNIFEFQHVDIHVDRDLHRRLDFQQDRSYSRLNIDVPDLNLPEIHRNRDRFK